MSIETMKLALDYLDAPSSKVWAAGTQYKVITALRAAIEQAEKQEPVRHWSDCAVHNAPAYPSGKCDCGGFPIAWFDPKGIQLEFDIEDCFSLQEKDGYKPLYTAPPQREWQGLTDEDWNIGKHSADFIAGAEWAEAKLKEKNT